MSEYGYSKEMICEIIKNRLKDNPDLKYYINNDYIDELVNLLIEGIAEAIEINTAKAFDDLSAKTIRAMRGV
jgi:predicted house-cleaning noncanonical NTP pyrophosphatase (MazG superfamily)